MTGFSSWSSYCTAEESILGHYTAKLMKKGQVDNWSFDKWSFPKLNLWKLKVSSG